MNFHISIHSIRKSNHSQSLWKMKEVAEFGQILLILQPNWAQIRPSTHLRWNCIFFTTLSASYLHKIHVLCIFPSSTVNIDVWILRFLVHLTEVNLYPIKCQTDSLLPYIFHINTLFISLVAPARTILLIPKWYGTLFLIGLLIHFSLLLSYWPIELELTKLGMSGLQGYRLRESKSSRSVYILTSRSKDILNTGPTLYFVTLDIVDYHNPLSVMTGQC